MVADIEEQTQRSGWLFGRGAFDKADLQYLRDFNNSLRYKEVEIEDKEKELWERERARLEAEAAAAAAAALQREAAALTRRSSGGSAGAHGTAGLRGPPGVSSKPVPLLLPVKVKPAGSKNPATPRATSPPGPGEQPSCKRPRTEHNAEGAAPLESPKPRAAAPATVLASGSGLGALRSAKSAPTPSADGNTAVTTGLSGGVLQASASARTGGEPGQRISGARVQSALVVSGAGKRDEGTSAAGLAGLLGGYGSEDDEEAGGEAGSNDRGDGGGTDGTRGGQLGSEGASEGRGNAISGLRVGGPTSGADGAGGAGAKLPPPMGLLSPEELLGDPRVISEGLLATRPKPQNVQGGDAWDSEEASSSDSED